jgi:hypothetical protein
LVGNLGEENLVVGKKIEIFLTRFIGGAKAAITASEALSRYVSLVFPGLFIPALVVHILTSRDAG